MAPSGCPRRPRRPLSSFRAEDSISQALSRRSSPPAAPWECQARAAWPDAGALRVQTSPKLVETRPLRSARLAGARRASDTSDRADRCTRRRSARPSQAPPASLGAWPRATRWPLGSEPERVDSCAGRRASTRCHRIARGSRT